MSCILRASGKSFDVDSYVNGKDVEFTQVYKKGESRLLASKSNGRKLDCSGVGIEVSCAGFDAMNQQLEDALRFLNDNMALVVELVGCRGVESVSLDFGVETKPSFCASYTFPAELVAIAGKLGISLCVSMYLCDEDDAL